MKNYTVRPYEFKDYKTWNAFIDKAKNATFLFHRDFMEYHKDRFDDFSLLVFDTEKLVALLPANKKADVIFSHQGLTYGGLVYEADLSIDAVSDILGSITGYLKNNSFKILEIKSLPFFYQKTISFELDFLLVKKNASLTKKEMNLAVDFSDFKISKSKMKHFRRISGLGIELRKEQSFGLFWDTVLTPRLNEKYNANPVHKKEEIAYLCEKFPQNIFQYNAYLDNELLAGITVFICGKVIKSQYGATTAKGEKIRALDFLFINLIESFKEDFLFFDMGTVAEKNEKGYNEGLLKQKLELGCKIYSQDFYLLSL